MTPQEIKAKLKEVAVLLPGKWSYTPPEEEPDRMGGGYFSALGERHIWASKERNKDRFSFQGAPPIDRTGKRSISWTEKGLASKCRISCSSSRSAEAIAKDVSRRLLPNYEDFLGHCLRRREEEITYEVGRERVIQQIKVATPGCRFDRPTFGDKEGRAEFSKRSSDHWSSCDVETYEDTSNLNFKHIPNELAIRLAREFDQHFNKK